MKTRTSVLAVLIPALALGLGACRSSSKDNPDSGMNNGDGQNGDDTSIYDIQDPTNKIQIGQQVNVRGVVVTAIDNFGAKKGDFWVEEPAGGAYSGVHVYGASLSDVAAIQVGDLVDVTGGVKNEFALTGSNADPTGRTVTELQPASGGSIAVAKVGDGTVPDPAAVDALAIGTMADPAAQDAEWEKWEGVLVTLDNVAVVGSVAQIGGSTPDPTLQKFPVTGPVYAESSLAAFPTVAAGDCLTSITGVEDYFYDYLILPRSTDEVATGGASCPAPETGAAACGDGVDNDANGHADCGDYSCISDQAATCVQDTTVSAINMGANATPAVNLKGVYVTGIAFNQKNLWVADSLTGAQYNGVYVYRGSSAMTLDSQIKIGSKVDVDQGIASAYHGLYEVGYIPGVDNTPMVSYVGPDGTVAPLTGVTIADLSDTTNQPKYLGTLVQLQNLKVTAVVPPSGQEGQHITVTDGSMTLTVDDTMYRATVAVDDCWATLNGIVSLNTYNNPSTLQVLPTVAGDIVGGGTCN
jgi:hypothetical protein